MAGGRHLETKKLKIRLFGGFAVAWSDGSEIPVRSTKLRGLIALLAADPAGTRSRAWLQDKLWTRSGPEHGRASLRQALKNLRTLFGEEAERLFDISAEEIRFRTGRFEFEGNPGQGDFLEGLDIDEPGFEEWLRDQRNMPLPDSMYAPSNGLAPRLLPSLAVLPLVNAPGNHADDGVGDMLAQEITRAMARSALIEVISHLSCRRVDPRHIDLSRLRHLLNTDYVIQGQFTLIGAKVRLDLDLIETQRGAILWTGEFRTGFSDFLHSDREMIWDIAQQIARNILSHSISLANTRPLPDVASHHLLMSSISLMHSLQLRNFAKARTRLEALIERTGNVSMLHAWLAQWYNFLISQGWSVDVERDGSRAIDHVNRALDIDPGCSLSLTMNGLMQTFIVKDFDKAHEEYQEALEIDPNNALAWLYRGTLLAFSSQGKQAVESAAKARRLTPLDPHRFLFDALSAAASGAAGNYEEALYFAEQSLRANHRHASTIRTMIIANVELGRIPEARRLAAKLLMIEPDFSIRRYLDNHPSGRSGNAARRAQIFERAGLPRFGPTSSQHLRADRKKGEE